jgi:hypothetical protein
MMYIQKCTVCGARYEGDSHKMFCDECMGPMSCDLNPANYTEEGDHIDD